MTEFFKKWRIAVIFSFFGILCGLILYRYLTLALKPEAPAPSNNPVIDRGSIVDRSGFPLAVQTNFYRIGLNTKDISNKEEFARNMADVFAIPESILLEKIDKKREYVILKKKATQNEYENIISKAYDNDYTYISYEKLPGRIYPNDALASQLIGYMGNEGYGLAGVEFSQQEVLSPKINKSLDVPEQGKNIYLTIDANLQYKLEQICHKTMETTKAECMMLLAADCKSGEILSYISLPSANLNDYGNEPSESKINRPSNDAYEPGSVFKIFTVGIVYDMLGIRQDETFLCDGVYEHKLQNGETIKIKCLEHHGWLTPREALKYSCNDVLGQISDRIDEDTFVKRIRDLGFGERTGIELSGETTGFVKDTDSRSWSARSKPTIAIGQEISVSAIQMVQAATAYGNNGIPVGLTVIKKITDKNGNILFNHNPVYKERVFKPSTAEYILSCMETTATTGTGARANLQDVAIGVKTGTAQMADKENGGYSDTDFLSNCMAIFPVDDPQIILYIVVEKAKGETYAGRIVAPIIAEAASTIIDYMGMSRGEAPSVEHPGIITIPPVNNIRIGEFLPDFTGLSKKELLPITENSPINLNINGSGWVTSQNPEPGTKITEGMTIELNLE